MLKPKPVLFMTRDGGLPSGNWPRNELVPYVRADLADALAEALREAERAMPNDLRTFRGARNKISAALAAYEEARK